MPNKFIPPQTTTTTRTAATPLDGEILYDTDEKKLYYGDGTTTGGKAIGSTTVADNVFRIQDNTDATKQIAFEASGITTGTTRTLTPPDSSGTIALIDTTGIADKDLFYYNASSKLFKRIAIGTTDQALIAKPSLDPPYQWGTVASSGREVLTANRTYYVRTDGSDSNTGLTDTSGGAFLTIQKAVDVASSLDQSIYTTTIQVGTGTFTQTITLPFTLGKCILKGDTTTLTNCVISTSSFCIVVLGDKWKVEGFSLASSTTQCIRVDGGVLEVGNLRFAGGAVGIQCFNGGRVFGSTTVGAVAITATGSFAQLFYATRGGIDAFGWAFTFTSLTVSSSAFQLDDLGYMRLTSATFTGSFTGTRYNLAGNSVLQTLGQATTWIPGTVSGVLATGGQYI